MSCHSYPVVLDLQKIILVVDFDVCLCCVEVVSGIFESRYIFWNRFSNNHLFYSNFENRCVRRKDLLETLAGELPKGTIRFSSKVALIEESGQFKLVHLADGSVIKTKVSSRCPYKSCHSYQHSKSLAIKISCCFHPKLRC